MTPPSPDTRTERLREEFKTIHNRFHGRFNTHAEVAKHAHWTPQELENVQIEDEETMYDELQRLIAAEVAASNRELLLRLKVQSISIALEDNTDDEATHDYIPVSAIEAELTRLEAGTEGTGK